MHTVRRTLVLGAGAAGLLFAAATAAGAHVSASPSEAPAGGTTVISFSTSHGCDDSPTTVMSFQIPEGVTSVRPTIVADWDITIESETLATPIDDGHGGQITERTASVTYTATGDPLEDGIRQVFPISMTMPETPDTSLAFPVVQTCVDGENAWIAIAEDGEEEPESPAPVVALVASESGDGTDAHDTVDSTDSHGTADGTDVDVAGGDTATTGDGDGDNGDGDGDGTGLAIAALVVGGLGLATGAVALARGRTQG